jgi:hypothetical protein
LEVTGDLGWPLLSFVTVHLDVCFTSLTLSRLDLTVPTMFQGDRKILKEGAVTKAKSGRKLHMVCCNDVLLLIENHTLYRMVSNCIQL